MIRNRTLEQAPNGDWYSIDAVTLMYKDMDGHDLTIFIPPEKLYATVHSGFQALTQNDAPPADMPEDMKALKTRMSKIMKASVKGLLMLWGDQLLTLFIGKEHDHPPKQKDLDLVNWYLDQFSRVLIAHMMKSDFVLSGQFVDKATISVDEVATRPITGYIETTSVTTTSE